MKSIKESILDYKPSDFQEEKDKELFLRLLDTEEDIFTRKNELCHFTASSWVVNQKRDKVLLCYHNIYKAWTWLGGHADGEEDLLSVALREVREESSLKDVRPLSEDIFSLESLAVEGHVKRGEYVSTHIHLNVTYLLEADDTEPLHIKEDENKAVGWYPIDSIITLSTEPWFVQWIYPKLNKKLKSFIESEKKNNL